MISAKRAKARQHYRHTAKGRLVIVNRGVAKKYKQPSTHGDEFKAVESIITQAAPVDVDWYIEGDEFEQLRKELRLPPAWTNVKISKNKDADLLATGKDSKGRTQYVYSPAATASRAAKKYEKIIKMAESIKKITAKNRANLNNPDKKISEPAAVLSLIQSMGLRPGSEKDTKAKVKAYGATTLEGQHVIIDNGNVRLKFVAKKGVHLDLPVTDKSVAALLTTRKNTVGDNGRLFQTSDGELRDYSKTIGGFNPKDYRTLKANTIAYDAIKGVKRAGNEKEYKKTVMGIAKKVSEVLGNTPTIALSSYINPAIFVSIKPEQ